MELVDNTVEIVTVPTCISPQYDWMNNKFGETPCEVVAHLIEQCSGTPYKLIKLANYVNINHYPPPNPNQVNNCLCSMPVYNLVSACAGCQQSTTSTRPTTWNYWSRNCQKTFLSLPFDVNGTVARWADIDNSVGSTNLGLAFYDVVQPNALPPSPLIFGSASPDVSQVVTTTQTVTDIIIPTISPNPAEESLEHQLPIKLIAGAAVGGFLFLLLLLIGYLYYRIKRNRIKLNGEKLPSTVDLHYDTLEKSNSNIFVTEDNLFTSSSSRTDSYTNSSSSSAASIRSRSRNSYAESNYPNTDSASFISSNSNSTQSPFSDAYKSDYDYPSRRSEVGSRVLIAPRNNLQNLIRLSVDSLPLSTTSRVTLAPSLASSTGAVYGRTGEDSIDSRDELGNHSE